MSGYELFRKLVSVPHLYYCDVYLDTRTSNIAECNYVYYNEKQHTIILTDLPYTDYLDLELIREENKDE